jgi:hypothetical protein
MRRLVLLQTPLHAAAEIERVIKDVKQDRMPLDEMGIEKPLDEGKKQKLLADAEAFAAVVKLAREWEVTSKRDSTKISSKLANELQAALK